MEFLGKEYQEPEINFTVGDVELECSPENTTLYTYRRLGNLAIYDHIFYHDEQQDLAFYGFVGNMEQSRKDELAATMLAHGYHVVANLDQVAECDLKAYDEYVIQPQLKELDNGVPGDWT